VQQPLLTVGIATLNRPTYLEQAIASVVAAARRIERPIQLVVSDMGGNPLSAEAYQRAIHDAPAWLTTEWVCDTTIPSGIANWNNCLDRATGRYYMMIGDDDRLVPGGLSHVAAALASQYQEPAGLLASARDIDGDGQLKRLGLNPRARLDGRAFLTDVITRKLHLRWCAFVGRTDILKACRPFSYPFPGGGGAADGAAIISAALNGDMMTHGANESRAISLDYQLKQRSTLRQFVAELPQATAADRALVAVWLGAGVRFQCLRWAYQGVLDPQTHRALEEQVREDLKLARSARFGLRVQLFRALSAIVGSIAWILSWLRRPQEPRG
jgi:hypothetical protein